MSKTEYQGQAGELRARLVQAQYRLKDADFSAIIVIAGNDNFGRNDLIHVLHEWMDPRFLETHSFGHPTDEEKERPPFWRYWRALTPKGRIGIFYGSWVRRPLMDRIDGLIDDAALDDAIQEISNFEKLLVDDGTLLFKFWLHLSEQELGKRLEAVRSDPQTASQVSRRDVDLLEGYDRALAVYERFVGGTSTTEAPWMIVDGSHDRTRNLTIGRTILDALPERLDEGQAPPPRTPSADSAADPSTEPEMTGGGRGLLDALDLTRTLPKGEYQKRLEHYQAKLHGLGQKAFEQGLTSILLFEGWDASGKGGAIRRIVRTLDPRDYRMIAIAAPTDEERARHYLWRFWRQIPPRGRIRLFDRSWYGRVLVERVEGFAAEHEWRRAYKEIRDFEEQLVRHGILLLKFWLHIDPQEQLRRFRQRERTPFKQHKMSDEDYRNRRSWDAYEAAAEEMVRRTGTDAAPWHLIEANDKRHARVKVLRIYCEELEKRLT